MSREILNSVSLTEFDLLSLIKTRQVITLKYFVKYCMMNGYLDCPEVFRLLSFIVHKGSHNIFSLSRAIIISIQY